MDVQARIGVAASLQQKPSLYVTTDQQLNPGHTSLSRRAGHRIQWYIQPIV